MNITRALSSVARPFGALFNLIFGKPVGDPLSAEDKKKYRLKKYGEPFPDSFT